VLLSKRLHLNFKNTKIGSICNLIIRFQEGEDLDDLLAEINEELPSEEEDEDVDPTMTNVQKRVISILEI
jgi:hypothetical protein